MVIGRGRVHMRRATIHRLRIRAYKDVRSGAGRDALRSSSCCFAAKRVKTSSEVDMSPAHGDYYALASRRRRGPRCLFARLGHPRRRRLPAWIYSLYE